MRVIAVRTLREYWKDFPKAKQSILAWYGEAEAAKWKDPNQLKDQFRNASILNSKRVVFNIHGNAYRLIVDIEFRLQIVFIVWFGTHKQYDLIDSKKISYAKAHKK
jgi:mRNA interferase HigB